MKRSITNGYILIALTMLVFIHFDDARRVLAQVNPSGTCSITGRLSGKLKWNTKDDRGQPVSFTLRQIYMTTPGAAKPVLAQVQGTKYEFANVLAGKTYRIVPGNFFSQPRERIVSCRPNETHTGQDFKITGPPPSG